MESRIFNVPNWSFSLHVYDTPWGSGLFIVSFKRLFTASTVHRIQLRKSYSTGIISLAHNSHPCGDQAWLCLTLTSYTVAECGTLSLTLLLVPNWLTHQDLWKLMIVWLLFVFDILVSTCRCTVDSKWLTIIIEILYRITSEIIKW